MKGLIRGAFALLVLLLLALPRVSGAEQTGSVSVRMTWSGQSVSGGSITLYRVAAPGKNALFVPTPEFSGCGVDLNGALSPADAKALAEHADRSGTSGQTRELGSGGSACFSPLEPGLYLLVQRQAARGFLPVEPFLVGLPRQVDGALQYHVDASPKCAPEPSDPGSPGIPQTGQLRWPVAVLAAAGLVLLAAGVLLLRKESHG